MVERRGGSLALRLAISAIAWSVITLGIAGFVLTELYRISVERNFDTRLSVSLNTLAGIVATANDDLDSAAENLNEPGFVAPLSGWYWEVRDGQTQLLIAASRSLLGEVLDAPPAPENREVLATSMRDPTGTRLRALVRSIIIDGRPTTLLVTGNADDIDADIAAFRLRVFLTLAVFAAGLVIATVLQIRWGLRPLAALGTALAAIRDGRTARLEGVFPRELEPMVAEINALIEANEAVVERARTHVGNLAHALKTPLSVVTNEARADGGPLAEKISEQAIIMRRQVDHYLERARVAAQRRVLGGGVAEALPAIEGLARVLRRAHGGRALTITVESQGDPRIRIDKRDLEEIAGNLMDNACKWARSAVRVTLSAAPERDARPMATIRIADDGPGVPPEQRGEMIKRGRRLDESVPGTGLGLSIVDELVEAYGGRMSFDSAPGGGLLVTVTLPQAAGPGAAA
jgi:signal transduction histidine kinase